MIASEPRRPVEQHHPQPFFLVGPLRSGTTLLRLLLGHHPDICRCDEMEYVASAIAGSDDWPDVDEYIRDLPLHRDFRGSGFQTDPSLSFPELARSFFTQLRTSDGRPIVGATVHNNFDELPRVWPEARFINLQRDPRDVACSCSKMGWVGNAWAGVDFWDRADKAWSRLRQALPAGRWIEVRYEDLTADPESTLARITAFLGVPYDPAMLDIEKDTTYERPNPAAARSWRNDAEEREVREMEARLGSRLSQAGYESSGYPPLDISPVRTVALEVENRLGRIRFAQKRYGFSAWAASVVSRRLLPIRSLRTRVQTTIDAVDTQYLK